MTRQKSSLKAREPLYADVIRSSSPGLGAGVLLFAALLAMALAWQDASANWEYNPSVDVGATFTNNINLAPDPAAEDELVFEVSPAFSATNDSKAWQVSIDYLMENLLFTRDSTSNETFHNLNATSVTHILQDELLLAISSRFYQQIIDPERSARYSNITTSRNFSDSWVNSISPQWTRNIGSGYVARASYSYANTNYLDRAEDGRRLNDVETQQVSAGLGSQRRAGRPQWDAIYSYQRSEPELSREFEYERLSVTGEYPLSGNTYLLAEAGAESDILFDPSVAGLEEAFGEIGLRWIRAERTTIEAAVGDRSFGTTYRASITHSGRRLTLSAGYSEDASTFALSQINPESLAFYDSSSLGDSLLGIDDRVFVTKAFSGSASWAMPRGEIRVSGYRNRREFIDASGDKSEITGLSGYVLHKLGPRTDLTLDAVWYRTEPGGSYVDGYEDSRLTAGVSRALGRTLTASVNLWRAARSAAPEGGRFEELAGSLFVSWDPGRP